jgi:hypothetical protein
LGKVSIRWKNSKQDDDLQASSGLKNTSDLARAVASGSMQSGSNHKQQLSGRPIEGKPFVIENVSAFASLVVLFMFRWRISRQSQSIKWLNCIAFLNVTIEESNQSSKESCVHFVTFLWTFLQEVKDFEKFSKSVDLVRAQQSDPYICVFVLFCMCYNHLLLVLDEVEVRILFCSF